MLSIKTKYESLRKEKKELAQRLAKCQDLERSLRAVLGEHKEETVIFGTDCHLLSDEKYKELIAIKAESLVFSGKGKEAIANKAEAETYRKLYLEELEKNIELSIINDGLKKNAESELREYGKRIEEIYKNETHDMA